MKSIILKSFYLAILFLTFLGCCKDCEEDLKTANKNLTEANVNVDKLCWRLNSIFENESENIATTNRNNNLSICDFGKEAVDKNDSWYITKLNNVEGKAFLKIPIPKGHSISKANIDKATNTVTFNVVGTNYTKEFQYEYKYVSGLSTKEGSLLYVNVIFNFDKDECIKEDEISTLTKKKKGSVVGGEPLH